MSRMGASADETTTHHGTPRMATRYLDGTLEPMILVTGGTGALGRVLVALLREGGHEVRVLSRRTGADLLTGAGLAEALDGTDVIVHCATDGRHDVDATRNLIAAASGQHLVYVSIVGIDRIPFPYYRLKLACERLVEECGLPWTTLRATQFHD